MNEAQIIPSKPRVPTDRNDMRRHLKRLIDMGYSVETIAERTGRSIDWINDLLSGETT